MPSESPETVPNDGPKYCKPTILGAPEMFLIPDDGGQKSGTIKLPEI